MSSRYINDRFLPDKAIDLIDEAASKVRLSNYTIAGQDQEITRHGSIDLERSRKSLRFAMEAYEKAGDIKKKQEKLNRKDPTRLWKNGKKRKKPEKLVSR